MIKILFLVDDDLEDREIFQEAILTCRPTLELLFAGDGVEALETLESSNRLPDVIFLDYNMPRMNGMDCLKALKSNIRFKDIPTIMYTTSGDREQEKVILRLGADHYMQKTNSFLQLCEELERLMALIDKKIVSKRLQRS